MSKKKDKKETLSQRIYRRAEEAVTKNINHSRIKIAALYKNEKPYTEEQLQKAGKEWRKGFTVKVIQKHQVEIPIHLNGKLHSALYLLRGIHHALTKKFGIAPTKNERKFLKFLKDDITCIEDLIARIK
jgi:hypothetical protein